MFDTRQEMLIHITQGASEKLRLGVRYKGYKAPVEREEAMNTKDLDPISHPENWRAQSEDQSQLRQWGTMGTHRP